MYNPQEAIRSIAEKNKEALDIVLDEAKKNLADGCIDCAFGDVEEWEMPCVMCKRNSKDYWRAKNDKKRIKERKHIPQV